MCGGNHDEGFVADLLQSISERIVTMVQHFSKLSMDAMWHAVSDSNTVLIIISISEC